MKKGYTILSAFMLLVFGASFIFIVMHNRNTENVNIGNKESMVQSSLSISSPVFDSGGGIPVKYTCDGANVNPPLTISGVPEEAKSLALIVDDPDTPSGTWTHWLLWNIDPATNEIAENSVPVGSVVGTNDFGDASYGGPCPPSGVHRYYFRIFALDDTLDLSSASKRAQLESSTSQHILAQGELMGKYEKSK